MSMASPDTDPLLPIIEVAEAVENERRRIARGLHDQVGPLLAEAQRAIADGDREVASRCIDEVLSATRSLTFDLGLPPIGDHGLGGLLETICLTTRAKHSIEVLYEEEGEFQKIDEGTTLVLSQIVRELLFNVVKHANASCSAVTLNYAPGEVTITVQDDGGGINVGSVNQAGFGLADARRRVDELGGQFEFGSKDGVGTRVVLQLPIPN